MYTFTVAGNTMFPWDMLRYDRCWPADNDTVVALERIGLDGFAAYRDTVKGPVELRLRSSLPPTVARWGSFLWGCRVEEPV